jgi:hypothetical protein
MFIPCNYYLNGEKIYIYDVNALYSFLLENFDYPPLSLAA